MEDPRRKSVKKKNVVEQINDTSDFNTKIRNKEAIAKNDSVVAATRAKLFGKDVIDQRREGNKAANATRNKEGVPQVLRGRTYTGDSNDTDKYAPDGKRPSVDSYNRTKPLEKEMQKTKNSAMINAMNFAGVKKKK